MIDGAAHRRCGPLAEWSSAQKILQFSCGLGIEIYLKIIFRLLDKRIGYARLMA